MVSTIMTALKNSTWNESGRFSQLRLAQLLKSNTDRVRGLSAGLTAMTRLIVVWSGVRYCCNKSKLQYETGGGMRVEIDKRTQAMSKGRTIPNTFPTVEYDLIRRPTPSTDCTSYLEPEDATTLEQALADQANRAFRCLSRHARWAIVNEITHRRAPH